MIKAQHEKTDSGCKVQQTRDFGDRGELNGTYVCCASYRCPMACPGQAAQEILGAELEEAHNNSLEEKCVDQGQWSRG